MNSKKILLSGIALIMAVSLAACGGDKAASKNTGDGSIKTVQNGKLTVGMECGYAPFNWTQTDDSNGAVAIEGGKGFANGYDVQMAKKVADELGLTLVISKTDWDGLPPAVNSGIVDAIMAGMSPTAERRKTLDFSDPYYKSQLVMVVRADGPYANATGLEDLKGARVTAQLNTFHYTVIDQINGVKRLEAMADFPSMRTALQSGVIDAYVSEKPEGLSASAALPELKMIEFGADKGFKFEPDDVNIAAGFKKGNSGLTKAVNDALAKVSDDDRNKLMEEVIAFQPSSN